MKQEVTRKHKAEKWALDDVVYHTEVTSYERMEQVKTVGVSLKWTVSNKKGRLYHDKHGTTTTQA